ncbi:MAG: BamA/TamA family outer membrane protein [Bacteroidota bacterium]
MPRLLLALLLALGPLAPEAAAQYFAFGKNRVQYDAPDWRFVQSEHFDVYFFERDHAPGSGEVLAAFTAEAAEEAYTQVAATFNYDLARRVAFLVYPSHNDFAVTNAVRLPDYAEGIGGVTELYKNRIAIPFTGNWRDFRRVIHHELVHAVVNDVFYGGSVQSLLQRGIRFPIPLWFNEGLAEYSAQGWDTNSDMYLRDAILEDGLAPIPRLSGYYAYRGGQGVWDFIAEEYGREKVTEILERVRLQRNVPAAIQRATGLTLRELSDRWHRTLKTVYFPEVAARDAVRDVARPLATRERGGAGYHASPVISPQGDKVAYVATRDGLFDVMVAETAGAPNPRLVLDAQTSPRFESLRILSPGMSWSPDGRRLAVAVKSGATDAVALIDVASGASEIVRPTGVDAIQAVAWSPDGERIAFEGTAGAHSDLWLLEIASGETTNLTRDLYGDHAPAWTPDGRALVFHSDRGEAVATGAVTAQSARSLDFDARSLGRAAFDLYRLDLDAPGTLTRLTADPVWDQTHARVVAQEAPAPETLSPEASGDSTAALDPSEMTFGLPEETLPAPEADPGETVVFLSDANGIPNLYALDASGSHRPLTNIQTGFTDVSTSTDGTRTVVLALDRGTPSVYLLRDPLNVRAVPETLAPTVWAQRRLGSTPMDAPALAIATEGTRERNSILRAAADGRPPRPPEARPEPLPLPDLRDYTDAQLEQLGFPMGAEGDSLIAIAIARRDSLNAIRQGPPAPPLLASADSLDLATVGFRDYTFGPGFERAAKEEFEVVRDAFSPEANRDPDGSLTVRRYKLTFSPDLVYAAGAYDTVFGVRSVTQFQFSDVLGEHRIGLATNLVLDLRNSDYLLSYANLRGRTDWGVRAFHLARELPDFREPLARVYRYRNYGLVAEASYPLSKFSRIDAEIGAIGVSLADLSDAGSAPRTRAFALPRVTYTRDATVPGFLAPSSGVRYAASISGSPGPDVTFGTVLADARAYRSAGPGYAFALRGSAGFSVGPDPQRFYASGVQNWLNPTFNSLPVRSPDDFVFATPVLPLRGFGYSEAEGDNFALVNVEARVPLIAALLPGPIPLLPLYNIQTVGFVDAGFIASGGIDVWREVPAVIDEETGAELEPAREEFDDILIGTGVGLRTLFLGYPVRVDWAWPFDGKEFGETRVYFSVGLDF